MKPPREVIYKGHTYTLDRKYYTRRVSRTKMERLHVKKWEDAKGPVPPGWVVHHKNGNPFDNRLNNLKAMPRGEHQRLHVLEDLDVILARLRASKKKG